MQNYTKIGYKYLNNDSSLQKRSFYKRSFSTSRSSIIKLRSGIGHKKFLNSFSSWGLNLEMRSSFSTSAPLNSDDEREFDRDGREADAERDELMRDKKDLASAKRGDVQARVRIETRYDNILSDKRKDEQGNTLSTEVRWKELEENLERDYQLCKKARDDENRQAGRPVSPSLGTYSPS